jgi:hypothetical protein
MKQMSRVVSDDHCSSLTVKILHPFSPEIAQ